jgi:hypothetical protein
MIVYKPYKGKAHELLPAVKASYLDLRKGGYVTLQPPKLMKASEGSVILVFEWVDKPMMALAQAAPVIQEHWMALSKICEFEKAMNLIEFQQPFSEFETIEWIDL